MKKNLILGVALLLCVFGANAQELLYEENFNYSDGQLTSAGSGANVSGGNWVSFSGTGTYLTVSGTGLTYSGYSGSGQGKKITITATTTSAEDAYRAFTTQSSGTVYASLLVNVANTTNLGTNTSNGTYFVAFLPSTSTSTFFSRVVIRQGSVASTVNFGIIALSGQTPQWISTDFAVGTTHLIVFSYQIVSGTNNDVASLWVNPTLSGTPSADVTQTASGTEPADIARLAIRQANTSGAAPMTPNADISGIRVGTSWDYAPLPVELTSFTAFARGKHVELTWKTATEKNNYGFEVQRSVISSQSSEKKWSAVGFVEGSGTVNTPKEYSYRDNVPVSGTYLYRLKQIDRDGSFEYHNAVEVTAGALASGFELAQNHPNPFNPSTSISYALAQDEHVMLKVYDMLGKEIATLVNGKQAAGAYSVPFDASSLPSGMYFYTLHAGGNVETKKMLLIK